MDDGPTPRVRAVLCRQVSLSSQTPVESRVPIELKTQGVFAKPAIVVLGHIVIIYLSNCDRHCMAVLSPVFPISSANKHPCFDENWHSHRERAPFR